jgi:DNA adenine methylase
MSDELMRIYADLEDHAVTRENYIKAPFNYPGNKKESLDNLLPLLPRTDVWVDVFGGTGVVTLNRSPSRLEVFNDRWSGLVSFYRCIRDPNQLDRLIERLRLCVHSREEFMWCKTTWENCEDDVERAARWYYMIQCSFACRGKFFGRILGPATPIAKKISENLPLFHEVHMRFRNVQVENLDFRECFKDYDSSQTVFYLDPPYYENNIYAINFTKQDHVEMLDKVFKLKGFVALSGYANDLYSKFPWDAVHSWPRQDKMATMATKTDTSVVAGQDVDTREEKTEMLWIKEAY